MKPPTQQQLFGADEGLDEQHVVKHFLGLDHLQAIELLHSSAHMVTEDFAYMAVEGLRYYLEAASVYLHSDKSTGNFEFCHGLLCSLSVQVRFGSLPIDLLHEIKEVADYCDHQRTKFGLEPHEDLFDRYCRQIYEQQTYL